MFLLRMILGKMEIWQWMLLAIVLIPASIRDVRTKKINGYICLAGILAALYIRECVLMVDSLTLMTDMLPGIVIYLIAYLSREKIGKGDALTLMFIGTVSGVEKVMLALFVSFSAAAVLSAVLLVLRKVKKDTKLPFLPFLSLGVIAGGLI